MLTKPPPSTTEHFLLVATQQLQHILLYHPLYKMSSSLGVTMALPAGTLEARRTEELSRRQQKQEQEKQQSEEEPRRLAPQRGKRKQSKRSTKSANTVLSNTQTPREQLPINIPINIQDDDELNQDDCDDANDMRNITHNVADWTLNNADKTTIIAYECNIC